MQAVQTNGAGKARTIGVWGLTILVALFFLLVGFNRLLGGDVANFVRWGYPAWFSNVVGAIEIVCAVLLLIPRTAWAGAAILVVITIGAALTHLTYGETNLLAFPIVAMILSALVGYLRRQYGPAMKTRAAA